MSAGGRARWWAPLVGLLAILPRASLLRAGFTNWDDDRFITENPLFAGPVGGYVVAALTSIQFEAYQPLHLLSYVPDRLLWPRSPLGFHALNLLLFGVAIALLFALLDRVVDRVPAALACLLFAWHPLVTEPVSWITARKDLLALALVLVVLHLEDRARDAGHRRWVSLVCAAAAILAKSAALVAPVFVYAWHRFVRGRGSDFALKRAAPGFILSLVAAACVAALWRGTHLVATGRPLPAFVDVAGTFGTYGLRVFWPVDLAAIYPERADHQVAAGVVFLLAVLLAAVFWRKLPDAGRFAALTFVGALLPVSNLIPMYFRFGDRYALLALLALAWPFATLLGTFFGRQRPLARVVALLVVTLAGAEAVACARLSASWFDSRTLWIRAVSAQPRAFYAHLKLGQTERTRGDLVAASAAYLRAAGLDRKSVLGVGGLFATLAERAEKERKIPPGTAQLWLNRMERGMSDESALRSLIAQTHGAGCPRCAEAAQWLGLRRFPKPDQVLLASAETALRFGQIGMALIYLEEIRDKAAPRYQALYRSARGRMDRTP